MAKLLCHTREGMGINQKDNTSGILELLPIKKGYAGVA